MVVFLTGGSASGKSGWGEGFSAALCKRSGGELFYLATMAAEDPESRRRVARHRAQREGKGFTTLERPFGLAGLELPPGATVLLEDLGNLCAGELYAPEGGGEEAVLAGLKALLARAGNLVAVGNELAGDGIGWEGMEGYLRALSRGQKLLAARADAAGEAVCGIPLWHKRPLSPDFDELVKEATPR